MNNSTFDQAPKTFYNFAAEIVLNEARGLNKKFFHNQENTTSSLTTSSSSNNNTSSLATTSSSSNNDSEFCFTASAATSAFGECPALGEDLMLKINEKEKKDSSHLSFDCKQQNNEKKYVTGLFNDIFHIKESNFPENLSINAFGEKILTAQGPSPFQDEVRSKQRTAFFDTIIDKAVKTIIAALDKAITNVFPYFTAPKTKANRVIQTDEKKQEPSNEMPAQPYQILSPPYNISSTQTKKYDENDKIIIYDLIIFNEISKKTHAVQLLHITISDFSTTPLSSNDIRILIKILDDPHQKILIHCRGGVGRSGYLTLAALAYEKLKTMEAKNLIPQNEEEAKNPIKYYSEKISDLIEKTLSEIREKRPQAVQNKDQLIAAISLTLQLCEEHANQYPYDTAALQTMLKTAKTFQSLSCTTETLTISTATIPSNNSNNPVKTDPSFKAPPRTADTTPSLKETNTISLAHSSSGSTSSSSSSSFSSSSNTSPTYSPTLFSTAKKDQTLLQQILRIAPHLQIAIDIRKLSSDHYAICHSTNCNMNTQSLKQQLEKLSSQLPKKDTQKKDTQKKETTLDDYLKTSAEQKTQNNDLTICTELLKTLQSSDFYNLEVLLTLEIIDTLQKPSELPANEKAKSLNEELKYKLEAKFKELSSILPANEIISYPKITNDTTYEKLCNDAKVTILNIVKVLEYNFTIMSIKNRLMKFNSETLQTIQPIQNESSKFNSKTLLARTQEDLAKSDLKSVLLRNKAKNASFIIAHLKSMIDIGINTSTIRGFLKTYEKSDFSDSDTKIEKLFKNFAKDVKKLLKNLELKPKEKQFIASSSSTLTH